MTSAVALMLLCALAPAQALPVPVDRWEADIAHFERADRADPPEPGAVVFLGSSSIRLWESLQDDFPGLRILRRGFGGSTIRDATRVVARIVVPYQPRLVVLYAGDNDLDEGRMPDQVRDDFVAFVERVRRELPDTPIAFIAIKPSPARAHLLEHARRANLAIAEWAKDRRELHFIDIFTPMLDGDGRPRDDLFTADRLHMNRAGYELWIERLAPVLRQFAEPRPQR